MIIQLLRRVKLSRAASASLAVAAGKGYLCEYYFLSNN
jgi:hypothetical protein